MEITDTTGGLGGAESTYVPSIDGPLPGSESTDQSAAAAETAEQPLEQSSEAQPEQTDGAEQPSYSKDAVLNELIGKFAKDHPGLDPANAEHLKILNMLANKEKYIRELKSKAAQPSDGLTEFERSVLKPETQSQAEQRPAATEARPAQESPYGQDDIGAAWKRPEDAYGSLAEAWAKGDLATVNKIELGIAQRRMEALGYVRADQIPQMIDREIQQRLGDVIPHVRDSVQTQRSQENKEFALSELEKLPEWAGVRELEKEISGEPLIFAGERFPNTLLNKILTENPEILDINVRHKDPDTADRLTYHARYKQAMRISKQGQMDAGKAKQILAAGSKMAERSSNDRARQALNSGTGATGLPNGRKAGSVVQEMLGADGPSSFASL